MKKAFVAVEDKDELTSEVKNELDQLAARKNCEINGIMQCPRGMILNNPEVFITAMKKIGAECAFVTSPEAVIHEIQTDGKLAAMAKKENLKIIDATLEIDIADVKKIMPPEVMKNIMNMVNLKKDLDQAVMDIQSNLNDGCVMIITKDGYSPEIDEFSDTLAEQGYRNISIVHMQDYIPPMSDMLEKAIQKNNVDKIYVFNEYDSPELNSFLQQQEEKGLEVSYKTEEEIKMTAGSFPAGMIIH